MEVKAVPDRAGTGSREGRRKGVLRIKAGGGCQSPTKPWRL